MPLKVNLSEPWIRKKDEETASLVVSVECKGKHGVVDIPLGALFIRGLLFQKESPEEILKRGLRDQIEVWARENGLMPTINEVNRKVADRFLEFLKGIKEVEVGQNG